VRSAGSELYQSNSAERAQSIQQLHDEIETIAEAITQETSVNVGTWARACGPNLGLGASTATASCIEGV
jgi:hypothetical protein